MRIGELAKKTGVSIETIRFYEAEGLLPEPMRGLNNYRDYSREHLLRLHFIRHCRSLDMALDDVRSLIELASDDEQESEKAHSLVDEQIKKVDARIRELRALKGHLLELKGHCNGQHHDKPCGILTELANNHE